MNLNHNEDNVLSLIKQNPFISQQEIADHLQINRSTVATIISSLMKKRQILGKAYITNDSPTIVCIGGMNIDRKYQMIDNFVHYTSNPVNSQISVGGVARNIAENLGRLGHRVELLSLAGYDQDYEWIHKKTSPYVNCDRVQQIENYHTSSYTAILDTEGEMQFALADMAICDQMNLVWIENHFATLKNAQAIVLDLNLPKDSVTYLIAFAKEYSIPLYIVPVSGPKMHHLPKDLAGVNGIIVNEDETQTFFNLDPNVNYPVDELASLWLSTGIQQIIITRGSRSTYYVNQSNYHRDFLPPTTERIVDVTGAGDAFVAGFIHGQLNNHAIEDSIHLALTNAYHTIMSTETVRLELSAPKIYEEYLEIKERGCFHEY